MWASANFNPDMEYTSTTEAVVAISLKICVPRCDPGCFGNLEDLKNKIYRTIILDVFLYGCETWSLKLGGGGNVG